MQPEGSLPHSQLPATCPYPEPDLSSPCPHIPPPEDPSQYYPRYGAKSTNEIAVAQICEVGGGRH